MSQFKEKKAFTGIFLSLILLGTGTSVTQAAMPEFAKAGVLVGFCGAAEHRYMPAMRFKLTYLGLLPNQNIALLNTYNNGLNFGLTMSLGWKRQDGFTLSYSFYR